VSLWVLRFIFIELEIETNLRDLERAHQLSDEREGKIKSEIKNPFIAFVKRKGLKVAELLVTHKIDKLILEESVAKKSAFYVLEDAYVEFVETDADTVEEIIEEIKEPYHHHKNAFFSVYFLRCRSV